jgi:hypothetical protein
MIENDKQRKLEIFSFLNRKRIHFSSTKKNSLEETQVNSNSAKISSERKQTIKNAREISRTAEDENYSLKRSTKVQEFKMIVIEKFSWKIFDMGKVQLIKFVYKKKPKLLLLSNLNYFSTVKRKLLFLFSENFSSNFFVMLKNFNEKSVKLKTLVDAISNHKNNNNIIYFAKDLKYEQIINYKFNDLKKNKPNLIESKIKKINSSFKDISKSEIDKSKKLNNFLLILINSIKLI